MKKTSLFMIAAAIVAANACTKEIEEVQKSENQQVELFPITFTAGQENEEKPDSKVTIGADMTSILWDAADQINVFDGTTTPLPAFKLSAGAGTTSGTFTGSVADLKAQTYYAVYPYQADATYNATPLAVGTNSSVGGHVELTLPAQQQAVHNSVDPKAFIGVAKSDATGKLAFKNLGALVRIQIDAADVTGLESVSLSGNNLEAISGKIKAGILQTGGPLQTYVNGSMLDYVTLKAPADGFKTGTDYYFVIRPCAFKGGLTITAKYADGSCRHLTKTNAPNQNVGRNKVLAITPQALTPGLPNDLWIAYLHGQNVVNCGGTVVNKTTHANGQLIEKSGKVDTGVYFINPTDGTAANTPVIATLYRGTQTVVIGRFANQKSNLNLETGKAAVNLRGSTAEDYLILKNVKFGGTPSAIYTFQTNINNQVFENVTFDNCQFEILANKKFLIVANPSATGTRHLKNIVINGCDIKANSLTQKIVSDTHAAPSAGQFPEYNFTFTDNIVYTPDQATEIKGFILFHGNNITLNSVVASNNTFVNMYCNTNGYINVHKANKYEWCNNVFYLPNYATNTESKYCAFLVCDETGTTNQEKLVNYPVDGQAKCLNNYCFQGTTPGKTLKASKTDMKNGTILFTNVKNAVTGKVDPFLTKDYATPKFTLADTHAKFQGARR